jgi:hypothetical protein
MSLVDKLLQIDARKLTELPTGKYEVKRLSEITKTKFELKLSAIHPQRYAEIQRVGVEMNKKGGVKEVKLYEIQSLALVEGVKDPSLKDPELQKHYSAVTPKDLVGKMFLPGEIAEIYAEIQELSGYEADQDEAEEIEEIKNS